MTRLDMEFNDSTHTDDAPLWSAGGSRPKARRPFPARYHGQCSACARSISPGDLMRISAGRPVHAECPKEEPR